MPKFIYNSTYMRRFIQALFLLIFLILLNFSGFCADVSKSYFEVSKAFDIFIQKNEGETAFRSLLIPAGGRFEGLASAFTALSNDSSFFEANPAGSAIIKNTEISILHNNWIADSKLETFAYSQRTDNFGWGTALRCFYIPFTEYGFLGEKKASGFYSETFLIGNFSYNFLSTYDFKGLTIGANLKTGITAMPPFSGQDNVADKKSVQRKNAANQNAYAVLGDLGLILRANVLKGFYDDEPNFYFGLAFKNFGTPIRGDIPPAYISMGFAYKPFSIFLFSVDVNQTINLKNIKASGFPLFSTGFMLSITKYFNFLSGFAIKSGNPRITFGGEVNLPNIQICANYTLDLASQITNINRISIGAKFLLGDRGRAEKAQNIKKLYFEGLKEFNAGKYREAVNIWNDLLKEDKTFIPAKEAIKIAEKQEQMRTELRKMLLLE